ncbi:MAG: GNAT family N-acyltransferase [Halopseudomonas yangmingensis]|uniref:L-ornithine N(alpha)-acyltransferase n=1 Tax=Halopseudomonas yangmingensis TaxID=1720063 RepID=A0A1I4SAV7_9GAMM|nr:GNAT family N-acyltransferase [Halopseudomonas yangmingensis]SFM61619.1 Putative hemolysin [Halopseudomonas yangmingensis]
MRDALAVAELNPGHSLHSVLATDAATLRAAQRLRFKVFAEECGAQLQCTEPGIDHDRYDPFCQHLVVMDRTTGQVVATTRLLNAEGARRAGGFYSQSEFDLPGLARISADMLEIGRTCVHPDYRNGGTIGVLWAALAQLMKEQHYAYLMGCASIAMEDGGIQTQVIMQRLRERYLDRSLIEALPRQPVPRMEIPENVTAQLPPLLKAYMRLGARICGEPSWDPLFNVADVFILLRREQLCPRYARHFGAA